MALPLAVCVCVSALCYVESRVFAIVVRSMSPCKLYRMSSTRPTSNRLEGGKDDETGQMPQDYRVAHNVRHET